MTDDEKTNSPSANRSEFSKGDTDLRNRITQLSSAVEALRESEARRAAMLESALDCVITIDHRGRIIEFNTAAEETFGYAKAEVTGREIAETIIPPQEREAHRRGLANYLATGVGPMLGKRTEVVGMRKDGSFFPVELAIVPIYLTEQPIFTAYLRDITERVPTKETLRAITEGTASVTGGDFFRSLVRHLAAAFRVQYALVTECTDATLTRVRTLAFMSNGSFAENIEYELAGTPCERVISGEVCYYPERLAELFPKEVGLVSYLGIPLYNADGNMLGHLAVLDDKPMDCAPQDISVLKIFGARACAELERKRAEEALALALDELETRVEQRTAELIAANQRLTHEIVERGRAETQLRESEKGYRDLYEEAPDVYVSTGADGLIKKANQRAAELFGYTQDELMNMPIFNLVAEGPTGKLVAQQIFKRFIAGLDTHGQEVEFRKADGSRIWGSVSVKPIFNAQGEVSASRSIIVDITERKQAELALKHRMEMEELIASISANFINLSLDEIDDGISRALSQIGVFVSSDRSHVTLFSEDFTTFSMKYEWVDGGIEPQIELRSRMPTQDFPWACDILLRNEVLYAPRLAELPPEAARFKAALESVGIDQRLTSLSPLGTQFSDSSDLTVRAPKASWRRKIFGC